MPQLSIVTVYPRDGGVGISITETRAKFKNLLRDPRCSVLVSHADWWSGFLVFEGRAELTHSGNTDPEALRLPFFHNNDDFEEIIFYHKGSFFSRDNIHPGMMTVHPSGFTHGPHPKAFSAATRTPASGGRTETDEVAVMIDTRDAIDIAAMPAGVEFEGYVKSWRPPEVKQAAE